MIYNFNHDIAVRSGEPLRYEKYMLDGVKCRNEEQSQLRVKLEDVLYKRAWCLLVCGTVGNGKTLLAVSALNYWLDSYPYEGLYVTQESLVDKIKATYDEGGATTDSLIEKYGRCKLLVLDELTLRGWTEHTRNLISRIISMRYDYNLRTVIVGNVSQKDIKQMFEPHIISRLRTGISHVMVADDMREQEAI